MYTDPYKLKDTKLLSALIDASAEGRGDTGLLEGVVLSRLRRLKPPIQVGDNVTVKPGGAKAMRYRGSKTKDPTLQEGEKHSVKKVHYSSNAWWIQLKDVKGPSGGPLYKFEQFILKKKVRATA